MNPWIISTVFLLGALSGWWAHLLTMIAKTLAKNAKQAGGPSKCGIHGRPPECEPPADQELPPPPPPPPPILHGHDPSRAMKREEYMVRAVLYVEHESGEIIYDKDAKFGTCCDRKTAEAVLVALAGREDCFGARIELAKEEEKQ